MADQDRKYWQQKLTPLLTKAASQQKTEISKEVLAPADGVREDLVATAVKFLQNPKVQQSALSQKKAFLQRKGLTTEEIEIAVQKAGVQQSNVRTTPQNKSGNQQDVVAMQQGTAPSVPVRVEEVSRWIKARNILAAITVVSGISYAAYRLYKEFLGPWLFGYQTTDKRLEALEKMVSESVTNVNTTLISIEETLGKQQEKLQMLSHDVNSKMIGDVSSGGQSGPSLSELKSELSTIKGLLLNRRQFPAMPTTTPVLPAWQLASNSGDADSNNKGKNESEDTVAKKTLSPGPAQENTQDEVTDFTGRDQNESELSLSKKDSDIVAKNSNTETDSLENEAGGVQNEVETEKESEKSEVNATGDNEDGEGNVLFD